MVFFFRGLAAVFIVALTAFSVFAVFALQELRFKQNTLEQDQKLLIAAQSHAAKRAAEYAKDFSTEIESLSAQIDETLLKARAQQAEFQRLKLQGKEIGSISSDHQKEISKLTRKMDATAKAILEEGVLSLMLRHQEPRPFSYFKGREWRHEIAVFQSQLMRVRAVPTTVDLAGGEDTFVIKNKGEMQVDGVFHKSVETFKADNEEANIFFVKAPGLMDLENNRLTIIGDTDMDRVILDGCLSWGEEENQESDFTTWRATDTEQRSRTLRVTKGIPTKIHPICDNRYLKVHSYPILRSQLHGEPLGTSRSLQLSRAPSPLNELKIAPFGGIGISFKGVHKIIPDKGLEIVAVTEGKPAAKAGIKRNDFIIKVDGEKLAGMEMNSAIEKMRGPPGTSVTITFISPGHPDEKQVVLVREVLLLPARMLDDPSLASHEKKSYLVWDNLAPQDARFALTAQSALQGEDTKAFRIKNTGAIAAKPIDLRITKSKRVKTKGDTNPEWEILHETNCLTQEIPAGGMCHVFVRAKPVMDGQLSGYAVFSDGQTEHALMLSGYAVGIAGKLPPNVIGNGSACPAQGATAEIAISSADPLRSNNGYFSLPQGPHRAPDDRKQVKLFTVECQAWQNRRNKTDAFHCNDPGEGTHSATLREYRSDSLEGDWALEQEKGRHISAFFTCRDGVIDWINWTW